MSKHIFNFPAKLSDLIGHSISSYRLCNSIGLSVNCYKKDNVVVDELILTMDNGKQYKFYHYQDCCESVKIIEFGELNSIIGKRLLGVTENIKHKDNEYGSETTTIHSFIVADKAVVVVWLGASNGYYSEDVDFCEVGEKQ